MRLSIRMPSLTSIIAIAYGIEMRERRFELLPHDGKRINRPGSGGLHPCDLARIAVRAKTARIEMKAFARGTLGEHQLVFAAAVPKGLRLRRACRLIDVSGKFAFVERAKLFSRLAHETAPKIAVTSLK